MIEWSFHVTYVFLDVVQTTIIGDKGSNLLSILDKLNSSTLTDSRVRLLSLNTAASSNTRISSTPNVYTQQINKKKNLNVISDLHFLKYNSFSVRRTSKRLLPFISQVRLLVLLVSPPLVNSESLQLTPSSHTTCLTVNKSSQINI